MCGHKKNPVIWGHGLLWSQDSKIFSGLRLVTSRFEKLRKIFSISIFCREKEMVSVQGGSNLMLLFGSTKLKNSSEKTSFHVRLQETLCHNSFV